MLLIGSGPIVIGQGCEFDYSGTQALKALQAEGVEAVLVNPNPATIMTDKQFSRAVYIEPLTVDFVERVIARERPDAVLPTMGGQTALNLALALADAVVLARHGVRLIGASVEAIRKHGVLMGLVITFDRLIHESDEIRQAPMFKIYGSYRYYDPGGKQ